MKAFQLTRPKDSTQAIATAGKTKTAQQGADIRFIAGGTTLIDLMKLNVEQPQNLVDVNRTAAR
jgi:xanthine dehydrogenase YagS FAD-binding subunit